MESAKQMGFYKGNSNNIKDQILIYVVKLKKSDSILKARTMQRNLIGRYLEDKQKSAALVVFYEENSSEWRLSFVKMERKLIRDKNNNLASETILSSPKRHSFLVGSEKNHTCKSRFLDLMSKDITPSLKDIEEIFDVETVTDEFFEEYKKLYTKLKNDLDNIIKKDKKTEDKKIFTDFDKNNLKTSDFAKKLMGQIVFIYFLQKKGWLGVKDNQKWGEGDKDFFKKLYNKEYYDWKNEEGNNFFNNCLEPLFYKGLSYADEEYHINDFRFKVPFLNGGLFSPIINYDWKGTIIEPNNEIFEEIIETFDKFNFTVREDDPLEKEVAVDPEMLGKVFEKLLDDGERGSKGSFYTPREVVHYMCKKSIISYLNTQTNISLEDIEEFIGNSDKYIERIMRYSDDIKKRDNSRIKLPESIFNYNAEIDLLLQNVKIADPAVGSGAYPVGMMNEIVNARHILKLLKGEPVDIYSLKKETIKNSLYCVDIDYSATDITKLRFWLSLIVDEENVEPLPNLDNNVMCGNSLIDTVNNIKLFNDSSIVFDKDDSQQSTLDFNTTIYKLKRINELKKQYFDEKISMFKKKEKEEIENLKWEFLESSYSLNGGNCEDITQYKYIDFKPFFVWELEFSEVFADKNPGFDIVIGNPPYVSNKGIDKEVMKIYKELYGIKDDLYNYFFLKGHNLLKNKGVLSFITSNTYFSIGSKNNLRKLFIDNVILEIMDVENVFKDPEVQPAIMIFKKELSEDDYDFTFIDANDSFDNPHHYNVNIGLYRNVPLNVFFIPTYDNVNIFNNFSVVVNKLYNEYWEMIKTSKRIEKFQKELTEYRSNLKEHDLTLLGLITEGGQGLATANNGKFVGVLEGTHWADNILQSRPEKLWKAITEKNISELKHIDSKNSAIKFINSLNEFEIRELFDNLKEKYGRDIFGQGYLFRIISKDEIADLNNISSDEKENGINPEKSTYVLYDKGDKEGNRWYLKTPYYIDWSKENVKFLKTNSGKKGKGMPVVRNPKFYFKEGFCWTDVHTTYIKSRLKENGVYDNTRIIIVSDHGAGVTNDKFEGNYPVNLCMLNPLLLVKDFKCILRIIAVLLRFFYQKHFFDTLSL